MHKLTPRERDLILDILGPIPVKQAVVLLALLGWELVIAPQTQAAARNG
jgi:hypothetical protein